MTEGRQGQKELRALLRQLKAAEREERHQRETARAQRRRVKQRQVSRAHKKTHRYMLHCEEEIEMDEEELSWIWPPPTNRGAIWRQLLGNPWQHIDGQVGQNSGEMY